MSAVDDTVMLIRTASSGIFADEVFKGLSEISSEAEADFGFGLDATFQTSDLFPYSSIRVLRREIRNRPNGLPRLCFYILTSRDSTFGQHGVSDSGILRRV